jgi:hypothetical protein
MARLPPQRGLLLGQRSPNLPEHLVRDDGRACIISSDYVTDNSADVRRVQLRRAVTAYRGDPAEQGDNIGLALAAGLFKHASNLYTNGIR